MRGRVWIKAGVAALGLMLAAGSVRADLEDQARAIINAANLGQVHFAFMAVDVQTDATIIAMNADDPLMPASNMKLVTTSAAVRLLGPDFVFKTELRLIPPAGGGESHGAVLLIHGDGDPGLGDSELLSRHKLDNEQLLQLWVKAVTDAGIKDVDRLIVDDRVFDQVFTPPPPPPPAPEIWPAKNLDKDYCAQVSGLNFSDNCLDLYPEPTTPGESPRVVIRPAVPFLAITNTAQTVARNPASIGNTFWASRRPGTNNLTFFGKVMNPGTVPTRIPTDDPPIFFGKLLASRLKAAGVTVGVIERAAPDERLEEGKTLYTVETTLDQILYRCNKDSENLFAECLFKRMGRKMTGQPGSWENGRAAVLSVLSGIIGARASAITLADGSGLSPDNRVTAHILVDLLRLNALDKQVGPTFLTSLSVGGVDGTLKKRFVAPKGFRVIGKTGSIDGVKSLSGLLTIGDPAGKGPKRLVSFSILFNYKQGSVDGGRIKNVEDALVGLLAEQGPRSAAASQGAGK